MKLKIKSDDSYGKIRHYPNCPTSKLFTELLAQKSITPDQIVIIKKLGYEVIRSQVGSVSL